MDIKALIEELQGIAAKLPNGGEGVEVRTTYNYRGDWDACSEVWCTSQVPESPSLGAPMVGIVLSCK